jgi:SAM-dependent methyltransferase
MDPAATDHSTEDLFERGDQYDAMLDRGLRLTGEGKEYFISGRLAALRRALPAGFRPSRILDFGCGTGDTTAALFREYPAARVVGVDPARAVVERARQAYADPAVDFRSGSDIAAEGPFDLCYVNGVFHHIPPPERGEALDRIYAALSPGGFLALFENNPWNPGTRLVMRRIPFDRDARTLSPPAARSLLRTHGFHVPKGPGHLFFFPAALRALRRFEPWLSSIPLGGQYLVLGRRSSDGDQR